MTQDPWYAGVPVPRLLRDARGAYVDAVRQALAEAGFDDIPQHGGAVLAGLEWSSRGQDFTAQAQAVAFLRLSKQRSSQLIDTLVLRGYLERRVDPEDRRRMGVRPTERGQAAAAAIRSAVDAVDAQLQARLSAQELGGLRAGLAALAEIRQERGDEDV